MNLSIDETITNASPSAHARFTKLSAQECVKQYRAQLRSYKRPDFNRMILDLNRLGWTHEKIAFVLPVSSASTVSEWSRGGKPNYENGEAFVMLWQCLMQIQRVPRQGETQSYQYP